MRDLRYALRRLRHHRRASLLSISLLALGIGFATTSFSVLRGVLLRGLPFPEGGRIVTFTTLAAAGNPIPVADYQALRERQQSFSELGAFRTFNTMVRREQSGTRGLTASYVTGNLFSLLGAEPLLGRNFTAEDSESSAAAVAMISYPVWQAQFGGDTGVIGQRLMVNSEPMTVIGVMPSGFHFPIRQQVWAVLRWEGRPWSQSPVFAIGKLRPGVSAERARRELELLVQLIEAEEPRKPPRALHLKSYVEAVVPPSIQRSLRTMLAAALVVLLMASANCASLRLGEARSRRRELAVRLSLGAGRGGVARLLASESLVLVGVGAATGLGLAWALVVLIARPFLQGSMLVRQFWIEVRIDPASAAFAVGLASLAFLIAGLLPTLATGRTSATAARSTARTAGSSLVRGLVALQLALCLVLMLGAGLLARSALELLDPRLGFDPDKLATAIVSTYSVQQEEPEAALRIRERIRESLVNRPEIEAATFASGAPWWRGGPWVPVTTAEEIPADVEQLARAQWLEVLPSFFEVVGLPLMQGRLLSPSEQLAEPARGSAITPAVISHSFASSHFERSPLGQTFKLLWRGQLQRLRVVGVVADHGVEWRGWEHAQQTVYTPFRTEQGGGIVILRGRSGTRSLEQALEQEIALVDSRAGSLDFITFDQARAEATWVERRLGQLFVIFSAAAVALVGIGLYAVIALSVNRRRKEFGIRVAVGARPTDLLRQVLGEAGRHLFGGVLAGVAMSALSLRLLRGFLYQVELWDPAVLIGALMAIAATTLAAAAGPARLAARTDPARTLQEL